MYCAKIGNSTGVVMAMVKCSSCGKDVSSDAAACPSCGHPMKKKSGGWWWKIPLAIVGLIGLISGVGGLSGNRSSAGLPKCDSAKAKSDVMDAMKNSPAGRAGGLSIVTFENPKAIKESADENECSALAGLNNARNVTVNYKFTKDKSDPTRYLIEYRIN